jgi:hypothetical protein
MWGQEAGGQVLRRNLADQLPGEGRWGTALLLDGNVGIGGDVPGLLCRCRDLVGPGGLIICEVDPDPDRNECTKSCSRKAVGPQPCRGRASAGEHFSGSPPRST